MKNGLKSWKISAQEIGNPPSNWLLVFLYREPDLYMSQLITTLFNVFAVFLHWDLWEELDFQKTVFTLISFLINPSLWRYRNFIMILNLPLGTWIFLFDYFKTMCSFLNYFAVVTSSSILPTKSFFIIKAAVWNWLQVAVIRNTGYLRTPGMECLQHLISDVKTTSSFLFFFLSFLAVTTITWLN